MSNKTNNFDLIHKFVNSFSSSDTASNNKISIKTMEDIYEYLNSNNPKNYESLSENTIYNDIISIIKENDKNNERAKIFDRLFLSLPKNIDNNINIKMLYMFLPFIDKNKESSPIIINPSNDTSYDSFTNDNKNKNKKKSKLQKLTDKEEDIENLDFKSTISISKSDILNDLLYVFQAIDGKYIKFDHINDTFNISNKIDNLKITERKFIHSLSKLGWYFSKINKYLNNSIDKSDMGFVNQSFCSFVRNEMTDYFQFLAMLEPKLNDKLKLVTFKKLFILIYEPMKKLSVIAHLCDAVYYLKGGALCTCLFSLSKNGDPFIEEFIIKIIENVSKPIFELIINWITKGKINDPFNEFFINYINSSNNNNNNINWKSKYIINKSMIPSFIDKDVIDIIYSFGISVNFIYEKCKIDESVFSISNDVKKIKFTNLINLKKIIKKLNQEVNVKLNEILLNKFKIKYHCMNIKKFILFYQGDFIRNLMDALFNYMEENIPNLKYNSINSLIQRTLFVYYPLNYNNLNEFKNVRYINKKISKSNLLIDNFSLSYTLNSPLNDIFSDESMNKYCKIFNFFWQLRYVKRTLIDVREVSGEIYARYGFFKLKNKYFRKCFLLNYYMTLFVNSLQRHFYYNVIECLWEKFVTDIENSKNLDNLIEMHDNLLKEIKKEFFFLEEYKTIYIIINEIIEIIKNNNKEQSRYLQNLRLELKTSVLDLNKEKITNELNIIEREADKNLRIFVANVSKLVMLLKDNKYKDLLALQIDFNGFYSILK